MNYTAIRLLNVFAMALATCYASVLLAQDPKSPADMRPPLRTTQYEQLGERLRELARSYHDTDDAECRKIIRDRIVETTLEHFKPDRSVREQDSEQLAKSVHSIESRLETLERRVAELAKKQLEGEIRERNERLGNLARKLGSADRDALSAQQRVAQAHWNAVRKEWLTVQVEVARLKAELKPKKIKLQQQALDVLPLHRGLLQEAFAHDSMHADLQMQLQALETEMRELEKQGNSQQDRATTLDKIKRKIREREHEIVRALQKRNLAVLENDVAQLESELEVHVELMRKLGTKEQELREQVEESEKGQIEVEALKKEIERLQDAQ